ncbi:hypothetical protein FACS189472_13320 [Alphaproteobacteria bacterium]|nr:hypothetical protein FACS189472_13320 [Alphaproteobacteria bacterium]
MVDDDEDDGSKDEEEFKAGFEGEGRAGTVKQGGNEGRTRGGGGGGSSKP